MLTGTWYRGVDVRRLIIDGKWSDAWIVGFGAHIMSWSAALDWIDSVADEPIPDDQPFRCSVCGERDLLEWLEPLRTELIGKRLCHGCDFWDKFSRALKQYPQKNFVADRGAYTIGDPAKKGPFRGFGGRAFVVTWPDGHTERTTNLWFRGRVGENPIWGQRLTDTALLETDR